MQTESQTDLRAPIPSAAKALDNASARAHALVGALACALACALALAGCSKPKVPDHDDPPEPQASATSAPADAQGKKLREAIQQPIDQAEAARKATEDAAQRQREAIDAATGG